MKSMSETKRQKLSGMAVVTWFIVAVVIVYILFFVAVMIDERYLRTNWFSSNTPTWVSEVVRTLYPFWIFLDR